MTDYPDDVDPLPDYTAHDAGDPTTDAVTEPVQHNNEHCTDQCQGATPAGYPCRCICHIKKEKR